MPISRLHQDPKEAHDRRGAAFTFDGASFVNFVSKLRTSPMQPHYAPSFSHSKKDPVENDIPVLPANRLVIFEGLYLTLRDQPWSKAGEMWDESYLVQVDVKTARERLVERHVRTGVAKDKAEAEWRGALSGLLRDPRFILVPLADCDVQSVKPIRPISPMANMSWRIPWNRPKGCRVLTIPGSPTSRTDAANPSCQMIR